MTTLFNAGLAVFIFRGNWKKPTNIFLGIYLACLSIWALALIGTQLGSNYDFWVFCAKLTYIMGLVSAANFYLFSISYPEDAWPAKSTTWTVYGLTAAYCLALVLVGPFLVQGVIANSWGNSADLEPIAYVTFTALFCFLYIGGLVRVFLKYLQASAAVRTRLLIIGLGVAITGIGGLYFDIILASPFINDFRYIWLGPPFNTALAILITYAVYRYELLDTKVIATELLIPLLWIFTFLRTMLAIAPVERALNGVLFILVLGIGALLIRSVRREVQQRERIEQLSEEKSEFMTFASHEIRNPITAMRGFASLIVDGTTGDVSPRTKDAAEKIFVTGNEVLMLISTFLNKSKMELGQIQYNMSSFDLGAAVGVIADGYAPHASQKGLQLIKRIDPAQKFMVTADEGKVKEVIGNVIDNSLKYTKQGSLTVSVERHGVATRVVVEDTGVGIPPETLPHLFKKFSRADAQKVNILGTGVGLYLAKTFIEGMKGRIWAESDGAGKGSRFIIEFPAAQ